MNARKILRTLLSSLMVFLMVMAMLPVSSTRTYAGSLMKEEETVEATEAIEDSIDETKGTVETAEDVLDDILVEVDADMLEADTYKMNMSSLTIQTEETYQLFVSLNGRRVTVNAWGSSDSSVASVDQNGLVTGMAAGSAVITAMVNGTTVECLVSVVRKSTGNTVRYNVLIMDASNSMKGMPLEREKTAAKRFCETVLNSDGENYLAVIALNAESKVICQMTDNYRKLETAIDSASCAYGTNLNAGLSDAKKILDALPDGDRTMKNVILCSDGLPQKGTKSESGHYTSKDHSKYYIYANAAYKTDVKIKKAGQFVYALGFFQNSTGDNLKFGKQLMKDLASKDKFYSVDKDEDIEDAMEDIADQITSLTINKTSAKIYVDGSIDLIGYVNGVETLVNWYSSDNSIAMVDGNGMVTGIRPGTVTITAEYNGSRKTCKITVYEKPVTQLNKSSLTIYKDCSATLKATVSGLSSKVTWKSSDTKIAKVDKNGKVTGIKKGTCTVTAKANGVTAQCKVTVKNPTIKLNKTSLVIYVKESAKLKATVHGKSSKVKWSSSKTSVATVSDAGKVTGKKEGTCYIKATCNGVTAKCKVTVEKKHPPYSFYVTHPNSKSTIADHKVINETGGMIKYNEDGKITKAGIFIQKENGHYYFIVAVKGENLTSVEVDYYQGKDGKMIYDYYNTRNYGYHMNHYYLSRDSYGVYSYSGSYGRVHMNSTDTNGNYLKVKGSGCNGKYFKMFKSLDSLRTWMNKD